MILPPSLSMVVFLTFYVFLIVVAFKLIFGTLVYAVSYVPLHIASLLELIISDILIL